MKVHATLGWVACLVAAAMGVWVVRGPAGPGQAQAQATGGTLPGARPEIRAEYFPSIQAAVDALPEAGGVVRLPAGEFAVTQPIVVGKGDVLIVGAGTATHIKNLNTQGEPALVIRPAAMAKDAKAMLWRVQLSDLRITGNPKSGHGVAATNVNEIYLDGVSVSENGGDGVHLINCYEDPRIIGCLFTYNKQSGVHLDACHDVVVSSNQFEENRDGLRCVDGFNLCMSANCLDDHLRDGVVIENTYGSVLAGNMIEECAGTAVVLDRDCYGITLSANVIAHENTGGIDLRDAHGCAVSGNTFTIVKKDALRIGPASSRIAVTGNTFADSHIGEGSVKRAKNDQEASGLTLHNTSEIAVVGNLFAGVQPRAVNLVGVGVRRVLLSENLFTGSEAHEPKLIDSRADQNLGPFLTPPR